MDINTTFANLTQLFAKHHVTIKINNAESFLNRVIEIIDANTSATSLAVDKMNEKIVPKHLYHPYKMIFASPLALFIVIEYTDADGISSITAVADAIDKIISIMQNDWDEFNPIIKSLFDFCNSGPNKIENFSAHFEYIDDKVMCLKILQGGKNFTDNLTAVKNIIDQLEGPDGQEAFNFLLIVSTIIIPSKRYMLNDVIRVYPNQLELVNTFFVDIFMQYYKIRLNETQYDELYILLKASKPLELIEAKANLYLSILLGDDGYKKLLKTMENVLDSFVVS